jgi:hypothetical protein
VLEGWRDATVGLALKLDPEPEGVFAVIARIKQELDVNVELASPDDFLPELADWRERSPLVGRFGGREVRHYDLRAQALAKLSRGFERDVAEVVAMLARELVRCESFHAALAQMEPRLERYPRVSARELERRLGEVCPPPGRAR